MVPEGWRITRLGKVVTISSGESPSSFSFSQAGKYPYVKVEDLNSDAKYLSRSRTFTDDERNPIPAGSIVFPKRGAAIATNKVRITSIPLYIDTNLMALRPNTDELDAEYLYYWIQHSRLFRIADTSSIPQINNKHITPMQIPLPRLEQQIEVRQLLSTWDRSIVTLEHLLQKKQQLKHGLMQQLLTGKRRLTGFRKPWKKALLSDLVADAQRPVTWREETLYRLASVRRWSGGVFEREALFGHQIKVKKLKTIKEGDLLISHIQSAYGAMALVPREFDGMQVSDLYTVLVPRDPATLDIRFLGYLSQRKRMWHQAYLASNGFFAERLRLNFDPVEFLSHAILVPPEIGEQQQIVQILDTSTREIDLLQRHLDLLKLQKRGLMQRLLTGQVRVKEKGATHG